MKNFFALFILLFSGVSFAVLSITQEKLNETIAELKSELKNSPYSMVDYSDSQLEIIREMTSIRLQGNEVMLKDFLEILNDLKNDGFVNFSKYSYAVASLALYPTSIIMANSSTLLSIAVLGVVNLSAVTIHTAFIIADFFRGDLTRTVELLDENLTREERLRLMFSLNEEYRKLQAKLSESDPNLLEMLTKSHTPFKVKIEIKSSQIMIDRMNLELLKGL